jgi:hypothetical protein
MASIWSNNGSVLWHSTRGKFAHLTPWELLWSNSLLDSKQMLMHSFVPCLKDGNRHGAALRPIVARRHGTMRHGIGALPPIGANLSLQLLI